MGGTIVLALFLAFLFGAGMLALVMGYISTEEKRAQERQERESEALRAVRHVALTPGFFAHVDASRIPVAHAAIEARMLADVERYVQAEQAAVRQFVNEPSIDSLYRQPGASIVH